MLDTTLQNLVIMANILSFLIEPRINCAIKSSLLNIHQRKNTQYILKDNRKQKM
jgi:hypothetical protein